MTPPRSSYPPPDGPRLMRWLANLHADSAALRIRIDQLNRELYEARAAVGELRTANHVQGVRLEYLEARVTELGGKLEKAATASGQHQLVTEQEARKKLEEAATWQRRALWGLAITLLAAGVLGVARVLWEIVR